MTSFHPLLFGLGLTVNNVLHTRVNLLLVVESIFFAALAQVRNSTDPSGRRFSLVLCVLGLAFTVLVWVTLRSLNERSDFLTEHLAMSDTLYKAYLDKKGLYSTTILTDVLPLAAAVVEEVGALVTNIRPGDRVGIPWLYSACGECGYCLTGWETLCQSQHNTGYSVNGGFAELALADARYVGKIPEGLEFADVAPHFCAGVTTWLR